MMSIVCRRPDSIVTTPQGSDECLGEYDYSIDSAERIPQFRWSFTPVRAITTTPEVSGEGNEWIEGVLPRLNRVGELPDNWDAEGSPRPDPAVIASAKRLLERLQDSRLGAVPVPFVCPIAGGGIQFEWTSSKKHLEIEFLDTSTIAFLKEDLTPQGELTECGEYRLADAQSTRQLLDWFAAV